MPQEGRTIAVDPSVIPLGTEVMFNGEIYIAEDIGGAIKGNVIESLHVFFTLFMTFEENQHFPVNDTSSVRNENIESLKLD